MPDSGAGMNGVSVAIQRPARVVAGEPGPDVSGVGAVPDGFQHRVRWASRVLWRGKLIVLVCLLVVLIPTIFVIEQARPLYTAEVRVMVEAPEVRDVLTDRNTRPWLSESVIETEAELITSTVLARRVVDRLHLIDDPEFNPALRPPRPIDSFLAALNPLAWLASQMPSANQPAALDASTREEMEKANIVRRFLSKMQVRVQRRTYVIVIRYTSETREKAMAIANTVADSYVLDRLEASFDEARRVSGWLGERLEVLRREVQTSERAAEDYRAQNGLRRKDERTATLNDQQLSELNSRLALLRAELAQKEARLSQGRRLQQSQGSIDTATDVLQSPLIQRLREQEATVQREMSDAQKTYGERHPRLVGIRAELAEIRSKIAGEIEKITISIANEVEVARAGVRALQQEVEGARQKSNVAGEAEVRLRELERQSEANRTLYEAFLNRFKREAEQEHMQRANARVVSPAELPSAPSAPRKIPILGAALLVGMFVGIALVFLLDRLDNVIRSGDEAEELTGLPVLGMIPLHHNRRERAFEEILRAPRSALADAVRSLRTSIDIGETGDAPIIIVTSSVPKEGKTFVSLCLAVMFSKAAPRVLLIDADLHRPRQHAMIGVDGERGLAQILGGEATFDEVVQRGAIDTLDFLPAGKGSNVSELMQKPALEALLTELKSRYDRVIIDTSPVLAVSDTRVLARFASRVIYLVRWNMTPRDAVRNGFKLLRNAGVQVFGVALSQVNRRKHTRYGYRDYGHYYGRYRDYYSDE